MSEEVYTVEQFAERLKLHPKTVLRFIREGRVRAVKVGKSWRILRSDLEAMTGVVFPRPEDAPRVTSIVDLPGMDAQRAQRLARFLPSLRTGVQGYPDRMSLDVVHDPARRHVKVIVTGGLADVAAVLKAIEALGEA